MFHVAAHRFRESCLGHLLLCQCWGHTYCHWGCRTYLFSLFARCGPNACDGLIGCCFSLRKGTLTDCMYEPVSLGSQLVPRTFNKEMKPNKKISTAAAMNSVMVCQQHTAEDMLMPRLYCWGLESPNGSTHITVGAVCSTAST